MAQSREGHLSCSPKNGSTLESENAAVPPVVEFEAVNASSGSPQAQTCSCQAHFTLQSLSTSCEVRAGGALSRQPGKFHFCRGKHAVHIPVPDFIILMCQQPPASPRAQSPFVRQEYKWQNPGVCPQPLAGSSVGSKHLSFLS